jgi:hypothetical protein
MRRAACTVIAFLVVSVPFLCGEPLSPLQRALAFSGAYDLLSQISAGLKQGLQFEMPRYDLEFRKMTAGAFGEFFNLRKLRYGLEYIVNSKVGQDELAEVVQWWESPLGQKIRMREARVGPSQRLAGSQKLPPAVGADASSGDRPALCQAMEDEFQLASSIADISLSIVAGLERTLALRSGATPAQVAQIGSDFPIPDKEPMRKGTIATCLFTYKNLSDEEMGQYIAYLRSPAGKTFMKAIWAGMRGTFMRAGMDAGEKVYESVQKTKTKPQAQ